MSSEFLDPATSLEHFFILNPALAFHDQRDETLQYRYARASVDLVTANGSSKTSSLKLITSTAGGLATFIVPNLALDPAPLESYIRQHFLNGSQKPTLSLLDVAHAMGLKFVRDDASDYSVPFEQNQMPLTHGESGQLAEAIQGKENRVWLQTTSEFSVLCESQAELRADWLAVLHRALAEDKKQREQLEVLLEQLITEGNAGLLEEYKNSPSAKSRAETRQGVISLAALSLASKLRNVDDPSQLPDEADYEFIYTGSSPQRYRLYHEIDIAPILGYLPYSSIVSSSKTPLPEPDRNGQPGEEKQCHFTLDVNASKLGISGVELSWGDESLSLSWPLFPAETITAEANITTLTLEITYGDYSKFISVLDWEENITLTAEDIGWYNVLFDANSLSAKFKNITGNATYIPSQVGINKKTHSFSFNNQIWQSEWLLNTYSSIADGHIEYRWQGKTSGLIPTDYDSGLQQATTSPITLQYNK
ncbi:hypothetical protein [Pantoea sp. A4]|uniref:hypothetical protein n=1 Tax=Pantoea sp. A4 TaxID=1225184 RepID=UPI000376BAA9|nr:hypothetical protein [Pantoea sp. A4]